MDGFPWLEVSIAVIGIVVPAAAFLYEFVYKGRKRLGFRVQMDTLATDAAGSEYAGVLDELQLDGKKLDDPSLVLLRIENNGVTNVAPNDYAVLDKVEAGVEVSFPRRVVAGLVVTELSDDWLARSFGPESGLDFGRTQIYLPKVPLNPGQHYKVLAVLQRDPTNPDTTRGPQDEYPDPKVICGVKVPFGSGAIQETKSHTRFSRPAVTLISLLVLVVLSQLGVSLAANDQAPLDCASGELTITGSTAFRPVLEEATRSYARTCPDASFALSLGGSGEGLRQLDAAEAAQQPNIVAFSDGPKPAGFPELLNRPIAFSLFTVVINKDAGVQDLSLDQIRRLYSGEIRNWRDIGGADLPVRLVGRHTGSGSRRTFEKQILDGREPADTSDDCRESASGARRGPIRCERGDTEELLDAVAETPAALGYAELGAAAQRVATKEGSQQAKSPLRLVSIDEQEASLEAADHDAYPFWETEYAYTHSEPASDTLAASFLRYLTNEVGKDIARSHGHRPCSELQNPVLCRPT